MGTRHCTQGSGYSKEQIIHSHSGTTQGHNSDARYLTSSLRRKSGTLGAYDDAKSVGGEVPQTQGPDPWRLALEMC